jgi:hypothetical protein
MFRHRTHLALVLSFGLMIGAAWSQSTTVWNPDFLRKLPRISTSAELDRLLAEFSAEADASGSKTGPADAFPYSIRPFKGGYTPLLLEDATGNFTKYGVWLRKGAGGRDEKLILVLPSQAQKIFDGEGYIPFDAALKKKIMKAKGITEQSDFDYVMRNLDVSSGRIMIRSVVTGDLLGHYLDNGQWSGTRADPEIEAQYQQVLKFADTTMAIHSSAPRAIVSIGAVKGSRIAFFEGP